MTRVAYQVKWSFLKPQVHQSSPNDAPRKTEPIPSTSNWSTKFIHISRTLQIDTRHDNPLYVILTYQLIISMTTLKSHRTFSHATIQPIKPPILQPPKHNATSLFTLLIGPFASRLTVPWNRSGLPRSEPPVGHGLGIGNTPAAFCLKLLVRLLLKKEEREVWNESSSAVADAPSRLEVIWFASTN